MRLGIIAFAGLIGVVLTAHAEENVLVDLSVLDGLNASYSAPSEPLFPVLPKREYKPTPRKVGKKASSKVAPSAEVKNTATQVEVSAATKPAVSSDAEVLVEQNQDSKSLVKETTETVVVVDVEPVAPAKPDTPVTDEPVSVAAEAKPEPTPAVPLASDTKPEFNEEPAKVQADLAQPVAGAPRPELLIDENIAPVKPASSDNAIKFAPGVDTLSADQMSKIDNIIGRFKDAEKNKIAIFSYNQDDGTDSFKKKRISLNRAIEVRSYLIKQGYKNFSIKVVNINADSDKTDMVEIEEI